MCDTPMHSQQGPTKSWGKGCPDRVCSVDSPKVDTMQWKIYTPWPCNCCSCTWPPKSTEEACRVSTFLRLNTWSPYPFCTWSPFVHQRAWQCQSFAGFLEEPIETTIGPTSPMHCIQHWKEPPRPDKLRQPWCHLSALCAYSHGNTGWQEAINHHSAKYCLTEGHVDWKIPLWPAATGWTPPVKAHWISQPFCSKNQQILHR